MADKTWWMTPAQLSKYGRLSKRVRELGEEHRKLIEKLKKKTLDEAGATRLREVIQEFNKVHDKRRKLEDKNPILPKNIVPGSAD